ncbi:MAG: hypothetical protein ABL921_03225, partial [Pirellula sp.]
PKATICLIFVGAFCLCLLAWSTAQPPQSATTPVEALPVQSNSPAPQSPPSPALGPAALNFDDHRADPLFQEIHRMLLKSSATTSAPWVPSPGGNRSINDSALDSISSYRWHAIESILVAARHLEQDAAYQLQCNNLDRAKKTSEAIKKLRQEVLELLGIQSQ